MEIKHIAWVGLGLLAVAVVWRVARDESVQRWWDESRHPPAAKIKFDNGTVRDYGMPASAPPEQAVSKLPPGALRKCRKGGQTTYTNTLCPDGFTELPVGGVVNVVGSGGSATSAKPAGAAASGAQKALRDALDLNGNSDLRERAIERAVNGGGSGR